MDADADDRDKPQRQREKNDEQGSDAVKGSFEHQLPREFWRRAQHQHRFVADRVEHRPCDLRADERGRDPCLDPLQLANFHGARDLFEVGLFGDKNYPGDGFLFEQLKQIVATVCFQIKKLRDMPCGGDFLAQAMEEFLHFTTGTGDHDIFLAVFVERLAFEPAAYRPVADDDQQETRKQTRSENQTARVELFGENGQYANDQQQDHDGLEHLQTRGACFFGSQVVVKSKPLEHQWCEGHGEVENPVEGFAHACIVDAHSQFGAPCVADHPADPKRKPHEQRVTKLEKLYAKVFAAAVDHEKDGRGGGRGVREVAFICSCLQCSFPVGPTRFLKA